MTTTYKRRRQINRVQMHKQFLSHSIFVNLRRLAILLFCGVTCSMLTGTLLGFLSPESASNSSVRTLTFAERVEYQRAIEDVYWRHRIWPKENPDPKPALNKVMSQTQLEKKVEDYLYDSQVLEDNRQRPLTAQQLQAEMDRMAQHTRQPEVLNELFEALGNDPFVIAECLARPVLSERLVADLSAQDKTKLSHSTRTKELSRISMAAASTNAAYALPKVREGDSPCIDGTWAPTSLTNVPSSRDAHTAVWTGTEMIVWGGTQGGNNFFNTGGRYNPSTDSWTATSTANAPDARFWHTAVWTGSQMIVWGGSFVFPFNTGGRYDPHTDSWTSMSITNAPVARFRHTAVWTGSEMIVWGGTDGGGNYFNTGGRYDPSNDSWTSTITNGAPSARGYHTAVWTDSAMIIWGGYDGSNSFNTGWKYDPGSNSWTATSTANAPAARNSHRAVWTGGE